MTVPTSVRALDIDAGVAHVHQGGALVDLRPLDDYLEAHIPGSLALLYEFGPGMAARARDCLPLALPLVLLDPGGIDISNAAAALRGKGFSVAGAISDGVNAWASVHGSLASTERPDGLEPPEGTLLDVGDPGAPDVDGALHIPIEQLWDRFEEVPGNSLVVVSSGYGVRAALAIGILERGHVDELALWKPAAARFVTRP